MPQIDYVGETAGTNEFHLMADGNSDGTDRRSVLVITVAPDDVIWVGPINDPTWDARQPTNGKVHRHDMDELAAQDPETAAMFDLCGVVNNGICTASLYAYVIPRIATLMARVYVPKVPVAK